MGDGAELWTCSSPPSELPGLVLLHGGPGLWDYLGPVADLAADRFRTHRYDQRACGRSGPGADLSMARWVADLDELRAHFGHDRWYVFGHSFGATLGLRYAAAHPDRVAGLVYCSGVGVDWPLHRAAFHDRAEARRTPTQRTRLTELGGRSRTAAEELEWRALTWAPDFADPADADRFAASTAGFRINTACNRVLNAEVDAWTAAEERAVCARVRAPVVVVHGVDDPRPVDGVRTLAAALPSAVLVEAEGTGHHPWVERPDVVRDALARAVDDAGNATPWPHR